MFLCCKAAENACKGCGTAIDQGCHICGACLCPEDRPSPIFVIFSFIVNIIALIIAVTGLVGDDKDLPCTSKCRTWLFVAIGCCAVNLLFAVYIYIRFMNERRAGSSAGDSAGKLFMYDPGVYVYIWFLIFLIVWFIMGFSWMGDEIICKTAKNTVSTVAIFFIVYLSVGPCVIFISLTAESCCRGTQPLGTQQAQYQAQGQNQQYAPPQQQPLYAQAPPATNPYAQQQQQQQPPVQQGGLLSGLVRGVIRKVI